MAERETRRLTRARADSQLPPGKGLEQFDFAAVPAVSKAHVMALAEADSWLAQGHNLLAFGPPGVGKTHLIAERYERKSIALKANAPFSAWDEVFPDKAMTVTAVDRLVHHATILEMNVDSYRRRVAMPQ